MQFPWTKPENRADVGNAVIQSAHLAALGDGVDLPSVAIAQAAVGLVARSFSVAEVTPVNEVTAALTPSVLSTMASSLVLHGNSVHRLDVKNGLRLVEATSYDLSGATIYPDEWLYRLVHGTPSSDIEVRALGDAVIHCRVGGTEYEGCSPLSAAGMTRDLIVHVERQLTEEASGAVGQLLAVPGMSTDAKNEGSVFKTFGEKLLNLKGKLAVVPSAAELGPNARAASSKTNLESTRIGMNHPPALAELRDRVGVSLLATLGIHPTLLVERGDGQNTREMWRLFVAVTLSSYARIIEQECQIKLGVPDLRIRFPTVVDLRQKAQVVKALAETADTTGLTGAEILEFAGFA